MSIFTIDRVVAAPVEQVWPIVSDVEGYAEIAPNISKAVITAGSESGMTRRCWDNDGNHWDETCTIWEPGHTYKFTIDTSPADYPYPFKSLSGQWTVDAVGQSTRITMVFEYELTHGRAARLLSEPILRRQFRKICEELLDNWQTLILSTTPA